jgi:iron complex outermembrane receptor protein
MLFINPFHGRWSRVSSLVLMSACVTCVQAQSATEISDGNPGAALEEIVVTAQKRSENLQDVPISVTAFSGAALEARGIKSVLDLHSLTPGLTYTVQAFQATPRIRGIGTTVSGAGNENSVATYVDGVYYASATGAVLSFNNVEQVAVLKGPQGTLFGRNATGGLIQITTADPRDEFQGDASIHYGSENTVGADLYLTGSLSENFAANFAAQFSNQSDGFGTNTFNGQDIHKNKNVGVRSKLKWSLGEATTAIASIDFGRETNAGPQFRPVFGQRSLLTSYTYSGRIYDTDANVQSSSEVEQRGISLNVTHQFASTQLVSISAYRKTDWNVVFDSDATPVDLLAVSVLEKDLQYSQELQLASTGDGALKWIVGAYFFHGEGANEPATIRLPAFGLTQVIRSNQATDSYAAFAQGTYALTDATSLTLGLRYTDEEKELDSAGAIVLLGPGVTIPATPYTAKSQISKLTWRLALENEVSDGVMAYASYNRGFKSGGFNAFALNAPNTFEPEQLDALEVGLKSELLGGRLRLNAAGFYYDFENIQLNTYVNSVPAIYNGEAAYVYGVDLDVAAAPTEALTLTAGLSWLHGRFRDFPIVTTALLPTGGLVQGPFISASGKKLPRSPDLQANIGVEYTRALRTGNLKWAADYSYSGRWYEAPENRLSQGAYSLVNASITWNLDDDDRRSFVVWGRNLSDSVYSNQLTAQVNHLDFINLAAPRTFGATFTYRF